MIQTAHELAALACDANAPLDSLRPASQSLVRQFGKATGEMTSQGVQVLVQGIGTSDLAKASMVAMVCGALVEGGADPTPIIRPLLDRVCPLFVTARVFHDAIVAAIPPDCEEPDREFSEAVARHTNAMPDEAAAWSALQQFFPPLIAVLSASAAARREGQVLAADAKAISRFHEAGHWIAHILQVLDNEPCLVIEPATNLAFTGRFSGISINFQLNVLLMDVFPQRSRFGLFHTRRVSKSAAAVARGIGPQQTDEVLTATWNLYAWTAMGPDRQLPDPNDYSANKHWIWNEGVPRDIPVFDGYRVILLGPMSYPRSWSSQRDFSALKADLVVEQELNPDEIARWLDRFAIAAKP